MVEKNIQLLHRYKIPYEISLIYGLPNQTLSSFSQSIDWCLYQGVHTLKAFPLMLLRGTNLERNKKIWNLKESDDPIPVVIESSTFSYEEWLQMVDIAQHIEQEKASK